MTNSDLERYAELWKTHHGYDDFYLEENEEQEFQSKKTKLEESLEKGNVQLKCNHSCECTDCQWGCLKCETARIVNKAEQQLEDTINQLSLRNDSLDNLKEEYDRTVSELNTYKIKLGETLADLHIVNEQIISYQDTLSNIGKSIS